jgi:hypothetical protein
MFSGKLGCVGAFLVSLVGTLLLAGLLVLQGCRGPAQSYTSLGAHAFPLRHQFNQDAGKTRIVILPAPN